METKTINLGTTPNHWDKLTKRQLLKICGLFLQNQTMESIRVKLLLELKGIKVVPKPEKQRNGKLYFTFKKGKERFELSAEAVNEFCGAFDYLLEPSGLVKNLIPETGIGSYRLYGPADNLSNCIFEEFIESERCFAAFNKSKDEKYLDELVAVLYRPKDEGKDPTAPDYDGDPRQAFNSHGLKTRAKNLQNLDRRYKLAIYLFYTGCHSSIINNFPTVFSGSATSTSEGNTTKSFLDLVNSINNGDVTKNEQIRRQPLYEIFTFLDKKARDYDEFKSKTKQS